MKRHLLYNLLTTLCMMITMIMVVCVAGYLLRTPSWSRLLWDLPLMNRTNRRPNYGKAVDRGMGSIIAKVDAALCDPEDEIYSGEGFEVSSDDIHKALDYLRRLHEWYDSKREDKE